MVNDKFRVAINVDSKLAGTTICKKNSFERGLALKRAGLVLTFKTVYSACLQEYTVHNVDTKPALFRANTPSKEFLHMVVPASFIVIVTLILHTMQSFKHHLHEVCHPGHWTS